MFLCVLELNMFVVICSMRVGVLIQFFLFYFKYNMLYVSVEFLSKLTNSHMDYKQKPEQSPDFGGGKSKCGYSVFQMVQKLCILLSKSYKYNFIMVLQHLQIDKRTCWHGHAGGGLSSDPKNVVSTVLKHFLQLFVL